MGFRIDKIWSQYFQARGVTHKSRQDSENHQEQAQNNDGQQQPSEQDNPENFVAKVVSPASLEEVQKAIEEVSSGFQLQGVALVALRTAEGVVVRFFATNGQLIRQVSGTEFLQLKVSSHLDKISRGKVLDQKF